MYLHCRHLPGDLPVAGLRLLLGHHGGHHDRHDTGGHPGSHVLLGHHPQRCVPRQPGHGKARSS